MISSEVERTLVKSPPELWAELSDPASLSRHLGELGEIHIVRTEPESTVEWTAENTTGTVSIKPSGWGTKVKLSVTRELDETTRAAEPEPDTDAVLRPDADAVVQPEADAAVQPEALDVPEAPDAPDVLEALEARDAPDEPEAALRREVADDAEPAAAPAPLPEAAADAEPAPTPEPAAPEPRRGFFARLFGRRRPQAPERELAGEDGAIPAEPEYPQGSTAPGPTAEEWTALEPTAQEPAQRHARIVQADEPADAFSAVRLALTPEMVAAANVFATSPKLDRRASGKAPAWQIPAERPAAPAQPAETAQPVAEEAQKPAEKPTEDLAAELLKAEEAASAEVTAVLTAVLDRLGAAHHRPFSRA